jgi:hypothetical protein
MLFRILQYFFFASLIFSCLCCLWRFKEIDKASKVMSVFIWLGLLTELVAFFFARKFHFNLPVYIVYSFIEYFLLCLYFNYIIDVFQEDNIGIYIGLFGLAVGVFDLLFIEHFHNVNSNFLFFEGLIVIGLSLKAFARWLSDEDFFYVHKYPHFWFICILIFFWTITYLSWGLYFYCNKRISEIAKLINFALLIVNIITYFGLGSIFLLYPKMKIKK